ncbi:MAG: endopeptidase La [Myxococcales bacterium]|nr:endopeptidase La [Myxococcales bacterium]MCB9643256.1 endopeptidase La [Myxococcales bacterium]
MRTLSGEWRLREDEPLDVDEDGDIIEAPRSVVPADQPPSNLFVLPLQDEVLFPGMILPVALPQGPLREIITQAEQQRFIAIFSQKKDPDRDIAQPLGVNDLHPVGTVARLMQVMQLPNGVITALLQVVRRCRITKAVRTQPFLIAKVALLDDELQEGEESVLEALSRSIRQSLQEVVKLSPNLPDEFEQVIRGIDMPHRLADFVASHFLQEFPARQEFLETLSVRKRLETALSLLLKEVEMIRLQKNLREELQERTEAQQREYLLREQMKIIQRELGEQRDEKELDAEKYVKRIEDAKMPEDARKRAEQELKRLRVLPPEASEYNMIRAYLDWLCDLPWSREDKDKLNIRQARRILDQEHFGLERVKERILEFLAVRKLKPDQRGAILCLSGPPGVGKTSLGQSIAHAMGRKFFRFSLGGMRDEAEIKGHRRTYIGAMPGKILQGLARVGTNNPVFMLDEIDKIGKDWRGDPASALLEVLDPSQNHKFLDHYLDVPFDLSRVMFIATANDRDTIPAALLDRMEVIELPGYIPEEKVEIAKRYLLPRQLEDHGLNKGMVRISAPVMRDLVTLYTREAGVRNLNREISKIVRKVAIRVAEHEDETQAPKHAVISKNNLERYLGPPRFIGSRLTSRPTRIGSAVGLAWTPVGGDILFFETTRFEGSGRVEVTGRLGEVMSESARIALSYLKSQAHRYHIDLDALKRTDIHLHVPAGAVPKDGPSAGITITTALLSLLGGEGQPPRGDVAMTGEITLMGDVLPVGGIREKVVAAASAGVRVVIIPKQNQLDYAEVPDHIREKLTAYFVEHYDEVIPLVFDQPLTSAPTATPRQNSSVHASSQKSS